MHALISTLHRSALRAALSALLLFLVVATGSAQTVLRVIPHADLKNTDPIWTTAYITRNHGYMVYDTLFALDKNLRPQPQMVDSYSVSKDGKTYTFTLREGLRFHDGSAVTAADAVASLQRWSKRDGMGQKLFDFVTDIKASNARTFTMTLREPYGLVLDSIGKISSNTPFIMPERLAKTDAFTQVTEIVGSGPFTFVKDEWVPGSKVVYVKFDGYKPRAEPPSMASGGKIAKVDRVEWLYIPDPATALAALKNGEVDYYEVPPVDLVAQMDSDPNIKVEIVDPLGTQGWLRPNHLHPPFNNPKARQALLYLVKQEDYLRAIVGPEKYWKVCGAYFMCGSPQETSVGDEPLMSQNFDKARELMKEAGYNGEKLILMDPTDVPLLHGASLVTAQLLRKIGVNVEVQAMDWSTLTSRRAEKKPPSEGGWNIFHTWSTGADVAVPVANIGISGGCTEKAWFGWPCDKRTEDLRDAWAKETDLAGKQEIVETLQRHLYDVVPYVNYGQWYAPTAYRKNLNGVIISPVPFFWNISKG
jgi:peptide/nickel transport system substrate-binding protein